MTFSIKKNIPVNIVSEGGDILGTESREITYIVKVTSINLSEEGSGELTISRTTSDAGTVNYFTYPFIYSLDRPIFKQAEEQVISLPEFSGATAI
jgi:hypothetical protein